MLDPKTALNEIHDRMSGREWSPDTLEDIADVLALAGYIIEPPHDED
jgi:hypothetical protein